MMQNTESTIILKPEIFQPKISKRKLEEPKTSTWIVLKIIFIFVNFISITQLTRILAIFAFYKFNFDSVYSAVIGDENKCLSWNISQEITVSPNSTDEVEPDLLKTKKYYFINFYINVVVFKSTLIFAGLAGVSMPNLGYLYAYELFSILSGIKTVIVYYLFTNEDDVDVTVIYNIITGAFVILELKKSIEEINESTVL